MLAGANLALRKNIVTVKIMLTSKPEQMQNKVQFIRLFGAKVGRFKVATLDHVNKSSKSTGGKKHDAVTMREHAGTIGWGSEKYVADYMHEWLSRLLIMMSYFGDIKGRLSERK